MERTMRVVFAVGVCSLVAGASSAEAQQFPRNPKVDQVFAEWDKPDSPGCVVGVLQNGRFIYQRGYGMANLDYDIPNAPEMVYYVGSVSKQFTPAAVLLARAGTLSLDESVRKYVPELPDFGVPLTIRHLLHHISGLRYWGIWLVPPIEQGVNLWLACGRGDCGSRCHG